MFLNPFKVVDGLTRAAIHTALLPVRAVAEPLLTLGEVDPFESVAKSGHRIERALEDADEGLA